MQLKVKDLGFRYDKGPWLFRNLNFEIKAGEIVGLVAPSGRGKTTLSKILAGYISPVEGYVRLNNQALPRKGRNPIQLIFQHPEKSINPRWKMIKVLKEAEMLEQTILDILGIKKTWLDRQSNELSGGELQRFCIARSLSMETEFLIADEMTTMLDAINQAQIWHGLMQIAKKRQMGVIIVSHDEDLIQRLCERVIILPEPKHF